MRTLDPGANICRFGLLEPTSTQGVRRWVTFGIGLLTHGLWIGSAFLAGVLYPSEIGNVLREPPVYIDLLLPQPRSERPALKQPDRVWKTDAPKLSVPQVLIPVAPSPRSVPKAETPQVTVPVPPPVVPAFPTVASEGDPRPPSPPPRTGVFSGGSEMATVKLPPHKVQAGGFGSPQGFPGEPQGRSHGNVIRMGSFGLPPGEGHGNGTGGARGARGVVANTGFGSGIASGGGGNGGGSGAGRGVVRSSGFDAKPVADTSAKRQAPQKPSLVPVEILTKPSPAYTEEAREHGLQGEVVLSVVFAASGKLRVQRVVEGLGHGLDEAAWRAAEQIRFKPAQRDGRPVDFPATLRVVFQLAG